MVLHIVIVFFFLHKISFIIEEEEEKKWGNGKTLNYDIINEKKKQTIDNVLFISGLGYITKLDLFSRLSIW